MSNLLSIDQNYCMLIAVFLDAGLIYLVLSIYQNNNFSCCIKVLLNMKEPAVKSLFKYKPFNKFTLDIIANNRIYYPKACAFNDPFDTKCHFKNSSTIALSEDCEVIGKIFPDDVETGIITKMRKDMSEEINLFMERLDNFGILSLAEDRNDILMWSHYADDHKGLCIEFERSEKNSLGDPRATRKVAYTKNYPSISSKILLRRRDNYNSLMRVLYTKSVHWSYENEWRHFHSIGNRVYDIPGRIFSITFGARASDMDVDIVKKLVKQSIPLYRTELKEHEYGLKVKRII